MRNPQSAHKSLRIHEEAARWLHELRAGDTGAHAAYMEWLLESPQHVEAFLRVSEVDAALPGIDAARCVAIEARPQNAGSDTNVVHLGDAPELRTRRGRHWAVAATVAFVGLLSAGIWALRHDPTSGWTQYVTTVGEQRAIALEDGSLLHMNTASRVAVRYTDTERSLRLLEGEALFRVQTEPSRPFRVHSGEMVVQALGTQFNVVRRSWGSTVSVLEGRVRVDRENGKTSAHPPAVPELDAGEEIRVTNEGEVMAQGKANLARVNAWRQRKLVFMSESLETIAAEFNRYNRGHEIHVEGAAAQMREFEALSFDADDPESFLAVLERDPRLEILRHEGGIVVRLRPDRGG